MMTIEERIARLEQYVSECTKNIRKLSNKLEPLLFKVEKLQYDVEELKSYHRVPNVDFSDISYPEKEELYKKIKGFALELKEISARLTNIEIIEKRRSEDDCNTDS